MGYDGLPPLSPRLPLPSIPIMYTHTAHTTDTDTPDAREGTN